MSDERALSDASASDDGEKDDNWDEWNDSVEGAEPSRSLFCDKVLGSPEEAMQYDEEQYQFNIRKYAIKERLEEYDIFRCINFIRAQVQAGLDPLPALAAGSATSAWLGNDDFLKPVLEEDPLLFFDYEEAVDTWRACQGAADSSGGEGPASGPGDVELQRLKDENDALREALAMMAATCMPEELREEASKDVASQPGCSTAPAPAPAKAEQQPAKASSSSSVKAPVLSAAAKEVDGSYFDSYGGFGIHYEMISDKPRTDAYQKALECNPGLIQGKAVLDLGCGTGILSLFACRAGAAHVISVEGNQRMAGFAKQISKVNGYSSEDGGPMTVVQGKLEELPGLPVDKVDVLVSEWMGYALLFETMLDSVLCARDRFLRPGGAMLPDIATIHIAGASSGAIGKAFWKDVYGFNMSPIADEVHKAELSNANVHVVKPCNIVTCDVQIKELDLCTMHADDQDFTAEFTLIAQQPSSPAEGAATPAGPPSQLECHAIVLWFDTDFSSRHCQQTPVRLSTSWRAPPTHWAQTVMVLKEPVVLEVPGQAQGSHPAAKALTGRISMVRNKFKHRFLDISLEYKAVLSDGKTVHHTTLYSMTVSS